ncbi:MAG: hypothetical protein JNL57_02045 [Bacteroidetes bacterium]|nr:hypothetical protein [Bacteroidota bacterium]
MKIILKNNAVLDKVKDLILSKGEVMDHSEHEHLPGCEPVKRVIEDLKNLGFNLEEHRVSDFQELYFRIHGNSHLIKHIDLTGFQRVDNKLICDCHWSTVEIKHI